MSKPQTGTIVSIRYDRGFGFLCPDGRDGEEIFFHTTACSGDLSSYHPGDTVTFIEANTKKGKRALAVTLVPLVK